MSERDAPGYKDLVLRPTDLKSIRAAVSKGSRAAIAAIEALEQHNDGDEVGGESGTPTKPTKRKVSAIDAQEGQKEGEIRDTGMYLVKKTEDLMPPKGIVNSGQLEMELCRMFANAVMFNPLPTAERGVGRSLRLRKNGGDIKQTIKHEREDEDEDEDGDEAEATEGEGSETSTSETESGSEGGGIIADAREMFEDVSKSVARWREVEVERITGSGSGAAGGSGSGGVDGLMRQGSVSMSVSSAVHHDDIEDGGGTPGAGEGDEGVGRGRAKRRRVNE